MAQPYLTMLETLVAEHVQDSPTGSPTDSPTDLDLSCKHFFSGAALYANGNICASLTPKGLALKLPGPRADDLIRSKQADVMRYFDKSPIKKGYILLADYETRRNETSLLLTESLQFATTS